MRSSSSHTPRQRARHLMLVALAAAALSSTGVSRDASAQFKLEEATIGGIHDAIKSGALTCKGLVQAYLERASAYNGVCTQLVTNDGIPRHLISRVKPFAA